MLKKLDRYILKKYWSTFFFVVFIFTLISLVIDFSDKIDDFIEESLSLKQVVVDYYLNWIFYINGLLVPLYALIGVIFFTSRMAYNSEIISILNAGISFRRLMVPYLIGASAIAALHLLGNHYLIPLGNKTRLDFERTYVFKNNDKGKTQNIHMFIGEDTKAFIRRYKKRDTVAVDFQVERFKDNHLVELLQAKKAKWLGRPNRWELSDYEIRTFNGMEESLLISKGEKLDTFFNVYPEDFVRYLNERETMTTPDLWNYIAIEEARGVGNTKAFEVEIHKRTADPFTTIILTIIGMAVAARKVRGGIGLHLAIGIGLGAFYILLSKFSTTFVTNQNLPALIGVWIPNLIFLTVALILVSKAQK